MIRNTILLLILAACATTASAGESAFSNGPVFKDYGPVATVKLTMPVDPEMTLKHSFDVSDPAPADQANSTLVSAARFINMHARAGFAEENIQVAVVVHGQAVKEVAEDSASAGLIAALTSHGVRIIVCGQSAAYYDVATEDLLPGVEMALSAMTAHAVLQQQGYTLNPF
jgi:intracellular sulfur oxidation DsrE/DsrF family protein